MGVLGGHGGAAITVENTGTTVIQKYRAVQLDDAATLTRLGDIYVLPVKEVVVTSGAEFVGVAQTSIEPGGIGVIIQTGCTIVETDGTAVFGGRLTVVVLTGQMGQFENDAVGIHGKAAHTDVTEWVDTDFGTSTKTYALAVVNFGGDGIFA